MHLFQVSFDRCLFSRMVCPPFYTFSFSLFIYQKKKHKNQQVLFESGESAKVLCHVPWSYCLLGMSSLIKPSISGVAVSLSGL